MISDRPLRIAFIGTGRMAGNHVSAIKRLRIPAVLVGVYDRANARAQEFAALAGTQAFSSIEGLFTESQPDIVHVCTPPRAHFEAARAALEGGAHVYVEKPFALTTGDPRTLIELGRARGLLICAGHQLLRDPACETLFARASELGPLVQVDSHFAFQPVGASAGRAGARALAEQAIDILPHPLYALVAAMEHFGPAPGTIELAWAQAGPADLQAVLRAGDLVGRLSVSLRARPIASTLTLTGTRGSLTCDFVRSMVVGAANPGTEALEKILNPMTEGLQLQSRTALSLMRRLRSGISYPGLPEMTEAFYRAVATGGASPVSPEHLLRVTAIFESLVDKIETAARAATTIPAGPPRPIAPVSGRGALTVVTGARGFLGGAITKELDSVRGIGRGTDPDNPSVREWVMADLANGLPAAAVAGARVVVHAAAETAEGYEAHQRNTIDATRHVLHAMRTAGVSRLVLVSSMSVLRPPQSPWEVQDEHTPRPKAPRSLGPYTWGKCLQEELVVNEAAAHGIATRIVRPGALIDWRNPSLPGLMGRRLFGRWHLGLGRASLPIPVCDVTRCAEAVAWIVEHFEEAPPVVNLFDPAVPTRGVLVSRLRAHGWTGRMLWVPISVIVFGLTAARTALALAHGRLPTRLAAWSVLRARRYDGRLAGEMLEAVRSHHSRRAASADWTARVSPQASQQPSLASQPTAGAALS